MTSNDAEPTVEPTVIAADGGVQQIPAVIQVAPVPAVATARDALLRAISAEAQHVVDKFPGQASKALEQLAHAYALVTAGTTVTTNVTPAAGRRIQVELSPPNGSPIGDDYIVTDVPRPQVTYYPSQEAARHE